MTEMLSQRCLNRATLAPSRAAQLRYFERVVSDRPAPPGWNG